MPGQDGTGPQGIGPTGRGLGPCKGNKGYSCRGFGLGRGFGRGYGWRNYAEPVELTKEEKKKILEAQKKEIEKALQEVDKE